MSDDAIKKKRKRESATEARITYHTPAKSFERLFNESSLEETKHVVRRKMGLADTVPIDLAQKRGAATIVLEDEDDFKAFRVALKTSSLVELQVTIPSQDLQNPAPKKRKLKSLEQTAGGRDSVLSDQAESQLGSSLSAILPPPSESFSSAYRGDSISMASPEPSPAPLASKPAKATSPDKEPKAKEKRRRSKTTTSNVSVMSPAAKAKAEEILQRHNQSVANKPPRVQKKKEAKESKASNEKSEDNGKEDTTKLTSVQALPPSMDASLHPSKVVNNAPHHAASAQVTTKIPAAQIQDKEKSKSKSKAIKQAQKDSEGKIDELKGTSSSGATPDQKLCPICSEPFHPRSQCSMVRSGGAALEKRLEQLRVDGEHKLVRDVETYLENEHKREQLSVANRMKQSSSNKSTSKTPQDKQGKQDKADAAAKQSSSGPKTVVTGSSHVPVQKPGEGSENSSDGSNNAEQLVDDDEDMGVWDEVGSVGSVPSGFLRPASQSDSVASATRMPIDSQHSDSEYNTKLPSDTSDNTDGRNQRNGGYKNKARSAARKVPASEESEDEEESQDESDSHSTSPSPSRGEGPRQTGDGARPLANDPMRTPYQQKVNMIGHMNTAPAVRTLGNDSHHPAATGSSPLMAHAQSSPISWLTLPTLAGFRRGLSFKTSAPMNRTPVQNSVGEDERVISQVDPISSSSSDSDGSGSESEGETVSKRLRTTQRASSGRTKTRDRLSQL